MVTEKSEKLRLKASRGLKYAALVFAATQLALAVAIDRWLPEVRDPLYGQKLGQLRNLVKDAEHDRLVVMLGSSRTFHGFDAAAVESLLRRQGNRVIVYNFGLPGGGPLTELLTLRRLLKAGVHPDAVLIEALPALFVDEALWHEAYHYPSTRLWHDELALVAGFSNSISHDRLQRDWWANWYGPAYTHRLPLKRLCCPDLLPREGHEHLFVAFDAHGWCCIARAFLKPENYEHGLDVARQSYATRLGDYHTGPLARRAFDELLSLCRENGIAATLVVMPEGPTFRSWYSAAARNDAEGFLSDLGERHHVAVIDAREWCEESNFVDSHHLLDAGAAAFSRQLAEQDWPRSLDQLVARRTPIHSP